MPKKTTKKVAVRVNVSKAIREALDKLGVDAPAREVSEAVSRMSPDHAEKVKATGKLWDNYVSMQRSRMRGGNKKRRGAAAGADDASVSVANLRDLIKIGSMLKHPAELTNLFAAISNLGSPRKVQLVAQKLGELQTRYEDLKKVEAFLNDVESLGIRL